MELIQYFSLKGFLIGLGIWFVLRFIIFGFFTVNQNERAVKTRFGRAVRLGKQTTLNDPISEFLNESDKERYNYPLLKVIYPGGPYFKWPWERVYKVLIATETENMARDFEDPEANKKGTMLEAVTKDQLKIGLTGQIRYRVSERNLYAYLFGIKRPIVHVFGYFVAILREKIASFTSNTEPLLTANPNGLELEAIRGISINDLRKNLNEINDYMEKECRSSEARYGVVFDASLITGIDPPQEVESALAAINTANNHVSSELSLAQARADQKLVQSKRAVEIETLKAEAEVEPLLSLATELLLLKKQSPQALEAYLNTVKLGLFKQTKQVFKES